MVRGATHPLAPKIKKLFLADEDVGRLAQHTPHAAGAHYSASQQCLLTPLRNLLGHRAGSHALKLNSPCTGCAVEELVKQLVAGAAAIAQEKGLKTVTAPCLYAAQAPSLLQLRSRPAAHTAAAGPQESIHADAGPRGARPLCRRHQPHPRPGRWPSAQGQATQVRASLLLKSWSSLCPCCRHSAHMHLHRQPKAAQDEADGSPKKRGRVPNKAPDAGPAPAAPLAGFSAPAGFGAPAGFSAPSHGVLPAQHLLAPGTAAAMIGQPAQQQHAAGSLQGAGRQAEALLASNAPAAHTTGAVVAAAVIEEQEDDYDAE